MEEMVKPPGMQRLKSGIWQLRIRVPKDLLDIYHPKKHIQYSLKTKDFREAHKLFLQSRADLEHEFSLQRLKQSSATKEVANPESTDTVLLTVTNGKPIADLPLSTMNSLLWHWFQGVEQKSMVLCGDVLDQNDPGLTEQAIDNAKADTLALFDRQNTHDAKTEKSHPGRSYFRNKIEQLILEPNGLHLSLSENSRNYMATKMYEGYIENLDRDNSG